jgi:hypothetical protein
VVAPITTGTDDYISQIGFVKGVGAEWTDGGGVTVLTNTLKGGILIATSCNKE